MVEAGPRFRPERAPAQKGARGLPVLLGMLMLVSVALALRPIWEPRLESGVLVEVTGEVPRPGTYLVPGGALADAVRAAGGDGDGLEGLVSAGDRIQVADGGVRVLPPSDPLLVALPVDLNIASVDALAAIPGLSRHHAGIIVAEREAGGPYASLEAVGRRAPGIGDRTLETLRPFVVPDGPDEVEPVDVNLASAAELERLPGIGPVTAARIVVEREDHGPFQALDELTRVRGIGPATIEGLREHAVVGPRP